MKNLLSGEKGKEAGEGTNGIQIEEVKPKDSGANLSQDKPKTEEVVEISHFSGVKKPESEELRSKKEDLDKNKHKQGPS